MQNVSLYSLRLIMDARVKPGHDEGAGSANPNKNSYRTVDLWSVRDYSPSVSLGSGASSGGTPKAERDAAPARGVRTSAPGRPRVAVRPHKSEGLPSVAGRDGHKGGGSRLEREGSDPSSRPGSTAPGTETAAGGAPGGAFPRSQGERERLASVPGGSHPPRRPRKPPRFPALYSPFGVEALGVDDGMTGRARA